MPAKTWRLWIAGIRSATALRTVVPKKAKFRASGGGQVTSVCSFTAVNELQNEPGLQHVGKCVFFTG